MIEHKKIQELISSYVDGEVSGQEKTLVEEHIKNCSMCMKQYNQLKRISHSLKSWPDENISPDLEQKIQKNLLDKKEREGSIMRNNKRWASIASTVTIVLVLLFSAQLYTKRGIQGRLELAQITPNTVSIMKGTQGVLRSATDNIGGQYSPQLAFNQNKSLSRSTEPELLSKNYPISNGIARSEHGTNVFFGGRSDITRDAGGYQSYSSSESLYPHPNYYVPAYPAYPEQNTEGYDNIQDNGFLEAQNNPLSTFSIDVDTASYSNIRRFITNNQLPPADAVRIEEMINYFEYDYPQPTDEHPFSVNTEISACPWNTQHNLVLIGLQGKEIPTNNLPPSNLVFLIDVSGSMANANKLPLVQQAMALLVERLRPQDRVAIVVYAGTSGLVLNSTSGAEKSTILNAVYSLRAGGSTAGAAGIQLAYRVAEENFVQDANNRVILATDGDFNVGVSNDIELVKIIEEKRNKGIFLTILGFGSGNYKDSKMEKLADKGNGNYAYVDTLAEAKKVFVDDLTSTLYTIAKDVKLQIEFNPAQVKAYRLIGYENRLLNKEDFNDDKKDAGELGAGHTVTALYEIVLSGSGENFPTVDPLKYQETVTRPSNDLLTVKLRYKNPKEDASKLLSKTLTKDALGEKGVSDNFQFASAVAEFGLLLRNSPHKANASFEQVLQRARAAIGEDPQGYRLEFAALVEKARIIKNNLPIIIPYQLENNVDHLNLPDHYQRYEK
ncbi:MAG: von Willebrand factor type A domain-containing protein [Candidatus Omnitrophota bacterium]